MDTSWINGKYENGEINTSLPYVAINEPEFFAQGDEAETIINEILHIWETDGNMTQEQAFNHWINLNL